jgi:hypothetical protein
VEVRCALCCGEQVSVTNDAAGGPATGPRI